MLIYDDYNFPIHLVSFLAKLTAATQESNVEWTCVRKDSPVYLSTAIAFGVDNGKKYFLTIQKWSPFYKVYLADNADTLKHNACMTVEKEVIMKVVSRDDDKDLFKSMKNLFDAIEQQVEAVKNEIKNREEMNLEKLLSSY